MNHSPQPPVYNTCTACGQPRQITASPPKGLRTTPLSPDYPHVCLGGTLARAARSARFLRVINSFNSPYYLDDLPYKVLGLISRTYRLNPQIEEPR
jgi:hypothetical protein